MTSQLRSHLRQLEHWLHAEALPLWWREGAVRPDGGFAETIGLDGKATRDPRRARVQPRQIFCFAQAGEMGWNGPWEEAMRFGLGFFDRVFLGQDGFYGALADANGTLLDAGFDLYNQAFALLGFASIAGALPAERDAMTARAEALLQNLRKRYGHPARGFEEDFPRRLPLCSNPHMHLFEAALAWEELEGAGQWSLLADEIAELCRNYFIDAKTGALREFFDGDWFPHPGEHGRVVEPGHQFEWAWLLARWADARGDRAALGHARQLFSIGITHGLRPDRKAAVLSLHDDFSVREPVARLWTQTEWLKAALRLAILSDGSQRRRYLESAGEACAALHRFLQAPVPGLWRDKMLPDGSFAEEASPASTFYHIVGAIRELRWALDRLDADAGAAMEQDKGKTLPAVA